MSQTYGSKAKVRWDRPKDRLNPQRTGKHLARLEALVAEVGKLWIEALEMGVYQGRRDSAWRPPTSQSDPTPGAALSPTQRQMRGKVKRASVLIEAAMEQLEEAASTLHDGFLLSDDEVLGRFLEKRQAATQGPSGPPKQARLEA